MGGGGDLDAVELHQQAAGELFEVAMTGLGPELFMGVLLETAKRPVQV
jgi:hypothetical protein